MPPRARVIQHAVWITLPRIILHRHRGGNFYLMASIRSMA